MDRVADCLIPARRLVAAIARGRLWLSQIESGAVDSVTAIALREDAVRRMST